MDGSIGSISTRTFRRPADVGGGAYPLSCAPTTTRTMNLTLAVAGLAAMIAWAPMGANADAVRAVERVAADSINLAHLEPGIPPRTNPATDLPDAISSFGDTESTVATLKSRVMAYGADSPQNFALNVRFNAASDETQCDIALRLAGPRDYYLVRIDGRGERITFLRVRGGRAQEIAGVERRLAANAWHNLRVAAKDSEFTVTLDEQRLFTAYDTTFPKSGRLAVWTTAANAMRFDGIAITASTPQ